MPVMALPMARLVGLEALLLDVTQHGHGEGHPPDGGDDEGDEHGGLHRHAQLVGVEHHEQAHDEGDAAAHVAPGKACARDLVHALVGGRVHQQRVVEHERRVEHDGGDDVDHQERQPVAGEAHGDGGDGAGAHGADDELLAHALHVGDRAQDGHEQGDDERGDGLGEAPGAHGHVLDGRVLGGEVVEVDGDDARGQQDEGGVAHVVHDPALLGPCELLLCHVGDPFCGPSPCVDEAILEELMKCFRKAAVSGTSGGAWGTNVVACRRALRLCGRCAGAGRKGVRAVQCMPERR